MAYDGLSNFSGKKLPKNTGYNLSIMNNKPTEPNKSSNSANQFNFGTKPQTNYVEANNPYSPKLNNQTAYGLPNQIQTTPTPTVKPNNFGNLENTIEANANNSLTVADGNRLDNNGTIASTPEKEGENEQTRKSFGQKSGDWLANNNSWLRSGIMGALTLAAPTYEANIKSNTLPILDVVGTEEHKKQDMLNSNAKNYRSFIRGNQSNDQVTNMYTGAIGTATKNEADNKVHLQDSDTVQGNRVIQNEAKKVNLIRDEDFHNKLETAKAQGKTLAMQRNLGVAKDFFDTLGQQAVQNQQLKNQNQTQQDEYEMIMGQEKIKGEFADGLAKSQLQLSNDLNASKAKIGTLTTRNKQLQATLTANPGDSVAKTEYDNNVAEIALEEGNQQVSGKYYQDWNSKNKAMNDKVSQFRLNQIYKGYNRIKPGIYEKNFKLNQQGGLFKSGGSLTLAEKKELESYKSNLKDGRDSKKEKLKDLRESLKESKLLAKELYKSSKEDRKEGIKLIMDFYKSIKNK